MRFTESPVLEESKCFVYSQGQSSIQCYRQNRVFTSRWRPPTCAVCPSGSGIAEFDAEGVRRSEADFERNQLASTRR